MASRPFRTTVALLASLAMLGALTIASVMAASAAPGVPRSVSRAAVAPGTKAATVKGSAATTVNGDFNGDGLSDMAAGVARRTINGHPRAGAVSVLYGSTEGVTARGSQLIDQDSVGALDQAEDGDQFGRYMGGGDFNGDGYFDLAVGVPLEDIDGPEGPIVDAGAVQVFYGSAHGVGPVNQFFTQLGLSADDTAEAGDWFGGRMQGGDFNGDGFDDLAVGPYFEDVFKLDGSSQVQNAGATDVLYGTADGLTTIGAQFWTQNTPGIQGTAGFGDLMGRALGSADFNGDGYADLAIGIRGEKVGGQGMAGACAVLYGSPVGLTAEGNQLWTQDSPGILDQAERNDWLGRTGVTGGDFNGDGFGDLAVGALQDSVGSVPRAGVVNVIYGSGDGLNADGNQEFDENTPGNVTDGAENGDRFGRTVEAADFNGDGFQDLAVGISNEDIGSILAAGAAQVLYGSADGLTEVGNQFWNQDSPGVLDQAEAADSFDGRVPDVGDHNGDGFADIAIGVFKEDLEEDSGTIADAGGIEVLYGSAGVGLTSDGNQFWTLDSPGVKGDAQAGDSYGQSNVG
jgi:hypothetical protein